MNRYDFIRNEHGLGLMSIFVAAASKGATRGDLMQMAEEQIDAVLKAIEGGRRGR